MIIEQLRSGRQPAQLGVKTVDVDQAKLDGDTVDVDKGAYVHRRQQRLARRRGPDPAPATSW